MVWEELTSWTTPVRLDVSTAAGVADNINDVPLCSSLTSVTQQHHQQLSATPVQWQRSWWVLATPPSPAHLSFSSWLRVRFPELLFVVWLSLRFMIWPGSSRFPLLQKHFVKIWLMRVCLFNRQVVVFTPKTKSSIKSVTCLHGQMDPKLNAVHHQQV